MQDSAQIGRRQDRNRRWSNAKRIAAGMVVLVAALYWGLVVWLRFHRDPFVNRYGLEYGDYWFPAWSHNPDVLSSSKGKEVYIDKIDNVVLIATRPPDGYCGPRGFVGKDVLFGYNGKNIRFRWERNRMLRLTADNVLMWRPLAPGTGAQLLTKGEKPAEVERAIVAPLLDEPGEWRPLDAKVTDEW